MAAVKKNVWVIGHRGASGSAPENTLAAFRLAVEQGARFIETDLRLSRDARLVAIHDATLDRTTSGRGRVRDFTLAELRQLDAGAWFAPEFAGQRIPTLEEILAFSRERDVDFFLEVKDDPAEGAEPALVSCLRDVAEAAPLVILSFHRKTLARFRQLNHTLMTGLLFKDSPGSAEETVAGALELGARQLAPKHTLVNAELVQAAHLEGLPVVTWTVNEPARMRELIALGVDGIMSDYPERLVAVLAEDAD
jgi:glycerophosphoryl diester phosphodiesterase